VTLECLDIPAATRRPQYDPESPMRQPAFWAGALFSRDADDVAARRVLAAIGDAAGRVPLASVPAYKIWLAQSSAKDWPA
jgi:hypothetical protein